MQPNKKENLEIKNDNLLSVSITTKYYFLIVTMIKKNSIYSSSNSCALDNTELEVRNLGDEFLLKLLSVLLGINHIISLDHLSVKMRQLNWTTATCSRNLTSNDDLFCVDLFHLPLPPLFLHRDNSTQLNQQEQEIVFTNNSFFFLGGVIENRSWRGFFFNIFYVI